MNLYIDIGNTNTKLNFEKDGIQKYFSIPTKDINSSGQFINFVSTTIKDMKFNHAVISSTVPKVEGYAAQGIKDNWHFEAFVLNHFIKTDLSFQIDNPRSLGIDLLCLAAYVSNKSNDGVIVNLGTATTILHVKNKTLIGGIIAPGLSSSFESLINNAAKLHEFNLELMNKPLGTNTKECISIGVVQGHVEMIKGLVNKIGSKDVYISGGNADMVKTFLEKYHYVKEATIEGIKILDKKNKA